MNGHFAPDERMQSFLIDQLGDKHESLLTVTGYEGGSLQIRTLDLLFLSAQVSMALLYSAEHQKGGRFITGSLGESEYVE